MTAPVVATAARIQLGLARIQRLLKHTELPWRAIHVAGTNGKGSICAFASAMLKASSVKTGRFTSPHIVDRWDCIAIDDQPIAESVFREVEDRVKWRDATENIQATAFELLTATAFEIFSREKVQVGVVEVGMGGKLDATNVLERPLATVISKIGLDHQEFLGDTMEAIAREKAGILKPSVPCVVDGTNEHSVKTVISAVAKEVGASPLHFTEHAFEDYQESTAMGLERRARYRLENYECAKQAVMLAVKQLLPSLTLSLQDYDSLESAHLPGRMQRLGIRQLTGRRQPVLLDGAHNPQSAALLSEQVEDYRKSAHQGGADRRPWPITWVLAVKEGKDITKILRCLIQPGDKVVTTAFGAVDGMSWVNATPPQTLLQVTAQICRIDKQSAAKDDLLEALILASSLANEEPLVVAGSLYLVGDILRILKGAKDRCQLGR
ncbi:MAG: folylpolyglutamate synthase [Bathelium mastoideum]|nr:MAG: folylpolyglutamate synthase [Bathelium mastoideum]KAI9688551.1 MAG: folylpolyglutamate synthase [Bathelium mastoideum]